MPENDRIKYFLYALEEQDTLLSETQVLNMSHFRVIQGIFNEINTVVPGAVPISEFNGSPAAMRSKIRAAKSRVMEIGQLLSSAQEPTSQSAAQDPRRVMLVHGRNLDARDAMFDFLRAINLDPIEWEQAIGMAGEGSPYVGTALDKAFRASQAAVVLLTGDEYARLGKRYLQPSDLPWDKFLSPQARLNVVFEAGMAFAHYSSRTILVSMGSVRPFSDIAGRHMIAFTGEFRSRQALADRLRIAGCDVKIEGKQSWHTSGNFLQAMHDADRRLEGLPFQITRLNRWPAFSNDAQHKRKVWFQFRNDSSEYLKVTSSGWQTIPGGINARHISSTLQIKLGNFWCPKDQGLDELHMHPGALVQTWVEVTAEHTEEDINRRIATGQDLGVLALRVNNVEMNFPI